MVKSGEKPKRVKTLQTLSLPHAISWGGAGTPVWFSEPGGFRIGRIEKDGQGEYEALVEFDVPAGRRPQALATTSDGTCWCALTSDADQTTVFAKILPETLPTASDPIAFFPASPALPIQGPVTAMSSSDDGRVWFAEEHGTIGVIETDGTIKEFPVPGLSHVTGITVAAQRVVWASGYFVRPDGLSGRRSLIRIDASEQPKVIPVGFPADRITSTEGLLWVSSGRTNASVARIDPSNGKVLHTYNLDTRTRIGEIARGPEGTIWVTEPDRNLLRMLLIP